MHGVQSDCSGMARRQDSNSPGDVSTAVAALGEPLVRHLQSHVIFFGILLLVAACNSSSNGSNGSSQSVKVVNAFPNIRFKAPIFLSPAPDGSDRVFVVEQAGVIRVFPNDTEVSNTEVFLDIRDRVSSGGERGLLGLAFHPEFAQNGFFYVNYTTQQNGPLQTVVARFSASGQGADVASEQIVLTVDQPFSNHNGGMVAFGPDGYLYIALGDGGSGGDPFNHGQNLGTLLGSLLRIDVDRPANGLPYGIPPDNPFVGAGPGVRQEIFAYGLRNPWRFSFDAPTGRLWAGDVGQHAREEVDVIEPGGNYGWRIMEGFACFRPASGCDQSGLLLPVVEYDHSQGCSITGGYVYRGALLPDLAGAYIYGDYCSGLIWSLRFQDNRVQSHALLLDTDIAIASFGLDAQHELYIVDHSGVIFRLSR